MEGGLKAVIFGGSGAVGKCLVPHLLQSQRWSKVLCVVRSEPQEWKGLKSSGKLQIQIQKDMDRLFKTEQWKLPGYDAMFVCFGSQVKHGQQTFVKVDKTYPLLCADIAINNKIPHYLIVTAISSNPESSLLYVRTKGQVERDLQLKKLSKLSILRPGIIKNRSQARCLQKIIQCFPCYPGIQCEDLALALKGYAQTGPESPNRLDIYQNQDLLDFVQQYKKKQYPLGPKQQSDIRIKK